MSDALLTAKEICAEAGFSAATLARAIRAGRFPSPERVGLRAVRWRRSAVDAAFAAMNIDRRDTPSTPTKAEAHTDEADLAAAAQWLAKNPAPPSPIIPSLRQMFGITALQACEVAARAFELRAGR